MSNSTKESPGFEPPTSSNFYLLHNPLLQVLKSDIKIHITQIKISYFVFTVRSSLNFKVYSPPKIKFISE